MSECAVALGSWVSLWPTYSSLTVPAYFRWPPLLSKYVPALTILEQHETRERRRRRTKSATTHFTVLGNNLDETVQEPLNEAKKLTSSIIKHADKTVDCRMGTTVKVMYQSKQTVFKYVKKFTYNKYVTQHLLILGSFEPVLFSI